MTKNKPYVLKKDAIIADILRDCPEIAEYFIEYGLLCVTCPLNRQETLEAGAMVHGIKNKTLEKMIKEINSKLGKEK
jgi:hybrid cluster-associated redox disulfide protein